MEPLGILVFVALVAMVAWQEIRTQLERKAHAREIERLQRLWKAETLRDYVASQAVLTRKPKAPSKPAKPGLHDDMWADTPAHKE